MKYGHLGKNVNGQLGLGNNIDSYVPMKIS